MSPEPFDVESLPKISQIVGPHGCGKSTLACQIAKAGIAQGVFDSSRNIVIRNGSVYQQSINIGNQTAKELLVVDGVENISWLNRRLFIAAATKRCESILLTTHYALNGVQVIFRLVPTEIHFSQIVEKLQKMNPIKLDNAVISKEFHSASGNYRVALLSLYDQWQTKFKDSISDS